MNAYQRRLRIRQLNKRIQQFRSLQETSAPSGGWIHAIRTVLGMSLAQLGKKLGITPQGVKDIELREVDGSISIQRLREAAAAMDMQLVYGLLPLEESLQDYIEKRARKLARKIVSQTAQNMQLENQGLDDEALHIAVEERTKIIIDDMPKALWD
jgi:predicted DNA-binding mobile mystery protein A